MRLFRAWRALQSMLACQHPGHYVRTYVWEGLRYVEAGTSMELCGMCGSVRMHYAGEGGPWNWQAPLLWRRA
jgi:hypothetical protein